MCYKYLARHLMQLSENQLRDLLFDDYRDTLTQIIIGQRDSVKWTGAGFPPIRILLQKTIEERINEIVDGLESLVISAKELRLEKGGCSTTRIDLFGNSECIGLTVIELKKSRQTERQAFTELLAYANHFCSIFPGLTENAINTILIAPMDSRTVRDAYVQEVLANSKKSLALIPKMENGNLSLSVFYPEESYYQWFENNLLDDRSMYTVAIAFPEIEGWIDVDRSNNGEIPDYSKDVLNTISSSISHKLEAEGFHSLVYATQKWGEIGNVLPYPNAIYVVFINPFAFFRSFVRGKSVLGASKDGRIAEIQAIYDQINDSEKVFWLESMESNFHSLAIRLVKEEFEKCFRCDDKSHIDSEISLPDWYGVKKSVIDSVCTHNLEIFQTGLLRKIYSSYLDYIFEVGTDEIHYYDDMPKYSFQALREFFPVWQILSGLGLGNDRD